MLNHIKDNKNHWTVIVGSKTYQFDPSHSEYDGLVECVKVGDEVSFLETIDKKTVIENWSEGSFQFKDGFLYYGDEQVASQPTERIISMIKNGWNHVPILNYLERLYQNVSNRAVMESYNWCSHKGLPITPDGYLLGYKGVAVHHGDSFTDKSGKTVNEGDLVDKYTGKTFRNNVGDEVTMSRRQVSDNCNDGCAAGLHVGTYSYATDWATSSGKVMLVKFSPSDIVSVPTDCNYQKMRVSKYTVVGLAREIIEEDVYEEEDYDEYSEEEEYESETDY
jgi:hypothetical protein